MKARTKKLSWYIGRFVSYGVAIVIFLGFILSLPIWQIKKIEVAGNRYIPGDKIISIAKIPIGENIFLIDIDEVYQEFSAIVQIRSLKIKRKLPGAIIIEIKERDPFAIAVIGSTPTLVDEEGYIIARNDLSSSIYKLDIGQYPVIRGIKVRSLEKGARMNLNDRSFMKVAVNLLSKHFSQHSLQLEMTNKDNIIVYIEDVLKVKLGDSGDLDKKIKVISALLAPVSGKWNKVQYIDVSLPDSPVIRYI